MACDVVVGVVVLSGVVVVVVVVGVSSLAVIMVVDMSVIATTACPTGLLF